MPESLASLASPPIQPVMSWGLLRLSAAPAQATYAGQRLPLSPTELTLLGRLMTSLGEFVQEDDVEAALHDGSDSAPPNALRLGGNINRTLQQHCSKAYGVVHVPGAGFGLVLPGLNPRVREGAGATPAPASSLPRLRTRVVGREDVTAHLVRTAPKARLMSLVGAGGIGKTTTAIEVASLLLPAYPDGTFFCDLSFLSRPDALAATVASVLHMPAPGSATIADIVAFARGRCLLLVLDNCEHLVQMAATLCEAFFDGAPLSHLLVTSREPLRCRGEAVYRLKCLPTPARDEVRSASEALRFAAVELFMARWVDRQPGYVLNDAEGPLAAEICRRLDGIPLAIELSAALADRYTLAELLQHLAAGPLAVQNEQRPLPPRHRSLETLLEWSHGLLDPAEQRIFERLSVFHSSFSMSAAQIVAGEPGTDADPDTVASTLLALASKSLVVLEPGESGPVCRLLETTRAFALKRLAGSTEWHAVARRHAQYLCDVFAQARVQATTMGRPAWLKIHGGLINDVRAALDWSFLRGGDVRVGLTLTAVSLPLAHQISLWDEYMDLLERAISHVDVMDDVDPEIELRLRWALALFLGQNHGPVEAMNAHYAKCLDVAQRAGDPQLAAGALDGVWMGAFISGNYPKALELARICVEGKREGADAAARIRTARMLTQSLHFMAHHDEMQVLTSRLLDKKKPTVQPMSDPAIDPQVSLRVMLARTLWIQGRPDEAADVIAEAVWRSGSDYSVGAAHAIAWGGLPVALWRGDHALAGDLLAQLDRHCAEFKLPYWQSWVGTYRSGMPGAGSIHWPAAYDAKQLDTLVTIAPHAMHPVALERALAGKAPWCQAEVLRARGQALVEHGGAGRAEGVELVKRALCVARSQGALAWELRCAISLARFARQGPDGCRQGHVADAHQGLAAVHARFREGFDTADLRAARVLLDAFSRDQSSTLDPLGRA